MATKPATSQPGRKPGRKPGPKPRTPDTRTPDAWGAENSGGDLSVLSELDGVAPEDDRALIAATLREIMRDQLSPAAARAQAARTLAEMVGALGRHAAPPVPEAKPLTEMTRAELEAELSRSSLQHD